MASTTTSTLLLLLLLILLPITSFAQSPPPQDNDYHPQPFSGSITVLIAILITAFFFMGFCSVYLHHCSDTPGNSDRNPSTTAAPQGGRTRSGRSRGLDASIISSFPTLLYSDVKHHKLGKHTLECAVCLTDFDDDDTLRLLPHCSHAFHPECIDMWLSSHTTCPVCRHNLTHPPPPPPPPPQTEEPSQSEEAHEVAVTVPVVAAPVVSSATEEEKGGGSVTSKVRALWRSRTTAGRMQQQWGEEERERFTLRLPEHVRRKVMDGRLRRSATVAVGEGRERRGLHRGEGSNRGGWSLKMRRESTAKSDRWAFLTRGLSFKFMRSGGGGGEVGGGGEGSSKGKAVAAPSSVLSPRDCFSGRLAKGGASGSGDDGDHLARV